MRVEDSLGCCSWVRIARMGPRLSIIIPCYNERPTLRALIERVLDAPPAELGKELIVVDDGSDDGSGEVLQQLASEHAEIKPLYHERNMGKGAAIRTAQKACTGEIAIIQDADLEYNPRCYPELLEPILSGSADVVYGSRFMGGRARRVLLFWHRIGNALLVLLSNMTTDLNLTDMETCYKAFRAEYFRSIPIKSNRFGFEPEITAKVARLGLRVYEVPIEYHGRTYLAGKKIGWKDGVSALWTILKYWLFEGLKGMDEGMQTLLSMRRARRYNKWVFLRIKPYVGDRVLETGAGIGNITQHLLDREVVVAVDNKPLYVEMLKHGFRNNPNVRVECQDLTDFGAYDALQDDHLNTVLCINVLEHIQADLEVLRALHRVLVPGGRAIVLVPQGRWLYGSIDRAVGHCRRYSKQELTERMSTAGFEVENVFALNKLGVLGWFVNGRILKRKTVPGLQVRLFDLLLPMVRLLDHVLPVPGLSVIAVGRKK